MTYPVGATVLFFRARDCFAVGVVDHFEADDGYTGRPEQFLRVRITGSKHLTVPAGVTFAFRRDLRDADGPGGWRWKSTKKQRPRIDRIEVHP